MGYYGYYGFYGYDWTYLLVLIGAILSLAASAKVNSTFNKYARVRSMCGMTAAQIARRILDRNGLSDIPVEQVRGNLSDHYDPARRVLRLSDSTYASPSVAAIGVAAHECGHALQHQQGYKPLIFRNAIVPAANIGSKMGIPLILLGLFFGAGGSFLVNLGIWVFSLAVLFQIVTLPVEFNASGRALAMLEDYGILGEQENRQAKKVLSAAAMTYVAAAATAILQLLRLVVLFGRNDRD
ncbi:MAG: zinc metallopeptidase [Lachnospiraceae bacterium]|nr:zinc metallopeptidase [Lachnospiraceae bacterium]MDD7027315.1 zinc metallopeptidase [Lachnospiraceae bacterium]MDY5701672.1 zinc metallopeptidase [Lachnospiraceae bacterium]